MQIEKNRIFGKIDMKNKPLIILFALFVSLVKLASAQTSKEEIEFDLPKTLFFTDEKIWIRASANTSASVSESQVIYAELLDEKSRTWALGKLPLENGNALNYLSLNSKIPSGNYLLRVFTRISANDPKGNGIKQRLVTILNPSLPPQSTSEGQVDFKLISTPNDLVKSSYSTNQDVEFQVPSNGVESVHISVMNPYLQGNEKELKSEDIYQTIEPEIFIPELFGHIVHAKLNSGNADTTQTYFLSAHGEKSALFTDRPDLEGNLFFDLGGFRHWDHLLIQVEEGTAIPDLEIVKPGPKTTFKASFSIPELVIHPEDAIWLEELKMASALEPYYNQEYRFDSIPVVTGFVADQSYLLDDYTRFETVETVIKEYVPGVAIRRRDKLKEFRLLNNPVNIMFDGNPLMMVDALPVFNSDMLANFNPKFFKKLEVLNREFYLNDRTYAGVLNFSSYENNFGLFPVPDQVLYLDYPGVNPYVSFEGEFAQRNSVNPRSPDFRSVLYWGENVPNRRVEFSTSNMKGIYELLIQFKDQNKPPIKEVFQVD